jgi:hypothetical protein
MTLTLYFHDNKILPFSAVNCKLGKVEYQANTPVRRQPVCSPARRTDAPFTHVTCQLV